jgi:hypothetical protein
MCYAVVVQLASLLTVCAACHLPSAVDLQAAVGAVRCYLALQDAPAAAAAATAADEASLAALSPEERKKEKLRRKKVCYITCYNTCYIVHLHGRLIMR